MGATTQTTLRFYAELNDFLSPERRQQAFPVSFIAPTPLRHLIETVGVPHTEVALALLNGRPTGLEVRVGEGDRLSLYPQFSGLDVEDLSPIQIRPEGRPRFIADAHLGKLAGYLRLLGFDTLYFNDIGDRGLVDRAGRGGRIVLSRDRLLLMRKEVLHGAYLYEQEPRASLEYLLRRYGLCRETQPFTRCMSCNGLLDEVERATVLAEVPPGVAEIQQLFWRCQGCGQLYWQGTHWAKLRDLVKMVCEGAPT